MPSNYEYSYFSQDVYEDRSHPLPGWHVLKESSPAINQNGYYGRAYYNEKTHEIIVVHRGTEFNRDMNSHLLNSAIKAEDGPFVPRDQIVHVQEGDINSDIQIAFSAIPEQYNSAQSFYNSVKEASAQLPDASMHSLSQSGHSLGGYIAQISAVHNSNHAVTFDNPGAKVAMDQLLAEGKITKEQYDAGMENIQSYQADSFINSKYIEMLRDNAPFGKSTRLDNVNGHSISGFTDHFKSREQSSQDSAREHAAVPGFQDLLQRISTQIELLQRNVSGK